MASNIKLASALSNAQLNVITTQLGASALLKIYDGTQPAGPSVAVGVQVLLGTLTCNATFAPAASAGVLTLNSITQDSAADATSTATWFRMTTSGGTALLDGTVGTSGADLNLNTVSIVTGGPIAVTSFTFSLPTG